MTLLLPKTGAAAVIYAKRFPSRSIASWMVNRVQPGSTVVDVGAHAGVYSLLGAVLASETGHVHAIEPRQDVLSMLMRSAELNGLHNVKGHCIALLDTAGSTGLSVNPRSGGAVTTASSSRHRIRAATLDSFVASEHLHQVGLVKLDAAGNELSVLRGGPSSLASGAIGAIICKLYHPSVRAERFGDGEGDAGSIVDLLQSAGYQVRLADGDVPSRFRLDRIFTRGIYSVPVLASL
jgi:FkbM family methyltransferase